MRWVHFSLCALVGCSGAIERIEPGKDAGATPPPQGSDAANPPPDPIVWSPCDLVPKSGKNDAECALVPAPRDYANPALGTITLGLKRVVQTKTPKAQLWLVDGGPGGSAVNAFAGLARGVLPLKPEIAVYAVDHRGVGGSHPLECPQQQSSTSPAGWSITEQEYPACVTYLKNKEAEILPQITSSNSARDLHEMIERLRAPSTKVFVYGGSYGTYLALRYMALFPNHADGVVLEGIVPPGRAFDDYDVEMDGAAKLIFDECVKDATCSAKLGPDPWKTAGEVIASFDQGHCPSLGLDSDGARAFLGTELFFSPIRDLIPIIVYRMRRCEPRDVKAIVKYYKTSIAIWGNTPKAMQLNDGHRVFEPLFFHVALSEMWHRAGNPPSEDAARAAWRKLTISTGLTTRIAAVHAMGWPTYPRGPEVTSALPAFDRPLLMLQGTFDAATTLGPAATLRDFYKGAGQTFVEFPRGAHQIVGATPTKLGNDCGERVLFQFLDAPEKPIDTSCTKELPPLVLSGTPQINDYFLGTTDGWDG